VCFCFGFWLSLVLCFLLVGWFFLWDSFCGWFRVCGVVVWVVFSVVGCGCVGGVVWGCGGCCGGLGLLLFAFLGVVAGVVWCELGLGWFCWWFGGCVGLLFGFVFGFLFVGGVCCFGWGLGVCGVWW